MILGGVFLFCGVYVCQLLICPLPLDIAGCCCYRVCMVELINQNQFLTTMNRTLQQLKESVDRLIEQQGAEASCAAYIFTKEDVFEMDDEGNQVALSGIIVNKVLNDLDETDYILEKAFDCIEDYIKSYV